MGTMYRRLLLLQNTSESDSSTKVNVDNYLTIEAIEDGLTASLSTNACEYCVDGDGDWKSLAAGTATESINSGQTLSFRGNLTPNSSNGIGTFTISKKCNLKGNCMSMLFGDSAVDNYSLSGKDYAFYKLFNGCNTIVNVSENFLPATTLASSCYRGMFMNCSNLINSPNLPAETAYDYSYGAMFQNCTSLVTPPIMLVKYLGNYSCLYMFYNCQSLTTAPVLYPSALKKYCYRYMFGGCAKLNYIKMLATNISATACLEHWVNGVASTGTFVKNPAMTTLPTATSSNSYKGIPSGWTVVNDGEESGSNLITFTVDGTEYQAEEGMTWEEFVNSEYNTNGFSVMGYSIYNSSGFNAGQIYTDTNSHIGTLSSDIIINGHSYTVIYGGWGD